jgi:hypothetical protein
MASDITTRAGKGNRAHRNVSTRAYRAGWEAIFQKKPKPAAPSKELPPAHCESCGSTNLKDTGSFLVEIHQCQNCGELFCQDVI